MNFQIDLPNIPVDGIHIRLRLEGQRIKSIARLPEVKILQRRERQGVVSFIVPCLETLAMFAIHAA